MLVFNRDVNSYERGMTLVEVLAALVLLALLCTSILSIFVAPAKWVSQARKQTTAVNYANALIENLRADRSKIEEYSDGVAADTLWPSGDPLFIDGPDNMQANIVIEEWDSPNLYDVIVTVNWSEGQESLRTVIRRDQE